MHAIRPLFQAPVIANQTFFEEVKNLRNDMNNAESRCLKFEVEKKIMLAFLDRAKTDSGFEEKLQAKINEAEDNAKKLKDTQKSTREDQQDSIRQMKLWRDLMKLLEHKKMAWQKIYGQRIASGKERFARDK